MEPQNSRFELGTNLVGIRDYSTQYPFLDYFKSSRPWITHGSSTWDTSERDKLNLDEHGWVKSLPTPEDNLQYTSVGTLLPNSNRGDRFVVLYEGEGTIQYRAGARKIETESRLGRDVFLATPNQSLQLRIVQTDPAGTGNYLRNIRVVPEQYVNNYESLLFNPDFVNKIKPYKVLRFMDWMETNNSKQRQWHQRAKITDSTYFDQSVPVEYMVALANQTGIHPWFNMPHQATDEYILNFAQYVKNHLASHLKVYVEFSNEVWNGQFQQSAYVVEQGKQAWPDSGTSNFALGVDWYSKRTTEITQIWDEVFGADKERVKGVMAGQAANLAILSRALSYAWASEAKTHSDYGIDAISIAPYFGGYLGQPANAPEIGNWVTDPDGGLNKLFSEITNGGVLNNSPAGGALRQTSERMAAHSELANQHRLELIAYEGGQHLVGVGSVVNNEAITNLFIAANRDARMGSIYHKYLTIWKNLGLGLFVHFTDITVPGKWGNWGALETIYQDSSPKNDALMEFSSTDL